MVDGKTNRVGHLPAGGSAAVDSARLIRQLAKDQADLIRHTAAVSVNFSPDFACPIAVANLQRSVVYFAEMYAREVERNAELMTGGAP